MAVETPGTITHLLDDLAQIERDIHARRVAVGLALEQRRKSHGLSFKQAARGAHVDPGNLSNLEKGKMWSRPMVDKLLAFYSSLPR